MAQYRRYGGIPVIRVLVVYSFILYCMCAFLLTVLPLPSREAVAAMQPKPIGWIPYRDLFAEMKRIGLSLSDPATLKNAALWRRALRSYELFEAAANVVMLMPLGFYARYYFRLSPGKTLLLGFLTSLFFELTQLSGLFFYYPHAYRFAETSDLIGNTLGTVLGYWLTPLAARLLPSREAIDELSYRKGRQVTRLRRLVSAVLDLLVFAALAALAVLALRRAPRWAVPACLLACLAILPWALRGSTPGQALVKLRTVRRDGQRAGFWRLAWRNLLLAGELLIPLACLGATVAGAAYALATRTLPPRNILPVLLGCALLGPCIPALLLRSLRRWGELPHSRFSRTSVISYNILPQEESSP